MRHPVPRQGSVFTPIIIFGLCITVVGVLVAPTLALDFAFRSGAFRPVLLAVPSECPSLAKAIERANSKEQPELLNQVLAALSQSKPDPATMAVRHLAKILLGAPDATPDAIKKCAGDLISQFPNATSVLLDTLEGKFGTLSVARETPGSIYPAVVEGCKKSSTCAKEIEIRYRNSKNPANLEGLRRFLGDVGPSAAPALLAVIAETPHLGFGGYDSPMPLHQEITQLLEVAIKDESRRTSWLLFVQDKSKKSTLRWRIARLSRAAQILNQEPWLVMSELLQSPNLPAEERWDYFMAEAAIWSTIPEVLSQIAADLTAETAKPWVNGREQSERCVQIIGAVEAFKRAPPAAANDVPAGAREKLSSAINQLIEKAAATFGPSHAILNRITVALEGHPLISGPLPVVEKFLASPASTKLGLKLLLTETNPSPESQKLFQRTAPRLLAQPATKRMLVEDLPRENETAAMRLLVFANSIDAKSRKVILAGVHAAQAKIVSRLEAEIGNPQAPAIEQVKNLSLLLTIKPQSPHGRKLASLIADNFTCDEQWASAMTTVISSGPDHPAFIPALFKIVSCPDHLTDMKVLGQAVSTLPARNKIQAHMRSAKNLTPQQLNRLTEVFGQTNRIPGSVMPPKIKRPGN